MIFIHLLIRQVGDVFVLLRLYDADASLMLYKSWICCNNKLTFTRKMLL